MGIQRSVKNHKDLFQHYLQHKNDIVLINEFALTVVTSISVGNWNSG